MFARKVGDVDRAGDPTEGVIQSVQHDAAEPAAVITPSKPARTQKEMWASSVEARVTGAGGVPATNLSTRPILLLTFVRQTLELEQALLACAATARFGDVQPAWANGAKIFVDVSALGLLGPG